MVYYIGAMPVEPCLQHFGILGMKWGVRRYQNDDGSLTAAGKARYGIGDRIKDYYHREREVEMRYRKAVGKESTKYPSDKRMKIMDALDRRKEGGEGYLKRAAYGTALGTMKKRLSRPGNRLLASLIVQNLPKKAWAVPVAKALDRVTRDKTVVQDVMSSAIWQAAKMPIISIIDEYKIERDTGISKKKIYEEYDREQSSKKKRKAG